ncbi:HKR1 [Symbiodinium sp. CCMP2592]|nr:HKR1 [Symbiodinium sp. CCMP2592]
MVKRQADLTTLGQKLEDIRALRKRVGDGNSLMIATSPGCMQCMGTLKDCSANYEPLRAVLRCMLKSKTIDSPSIDALLIECQGFLELCHYPEPERIPALALRDAWGIKRSLTTLRRKWARPEIPKDSVQDPQVRLLVKMYDTITEDGIHIPRRASTEEDVGHDAAPDGDEASAGDAVYELGADEVEDDSRLVVLTGDSAASSGHTTPAGSVAPAGASEPIAGESTEPTGPSEPITGEATEPAGPSEPIARESTEPTGPSEPIAHESTEPTGPSEPIVRESTEPTGPSEPIGSGSAGSSGPSEFVAGSAGSAGSGGGPAWVSDTTGLAQLIRELQDEVLQGLLLRTERI